MDGDLLDLINMSTISSSMQFSIALDITRGLSYLHDLQILHRDLKPENILIQKHNESITAKICDFGFAASMDSKFNRLYGSEGYLAPELYSSTRPYPYSIKSDIYAFAMIVWVMASRCMPFNNIPESSIPIATHIDLAMLIDDCWAQNPKHRPLTAEINNRLSEAMALPYEQRRIELLHYSQNTGDLSEARKTELRTLITRHPHITLTRVLDDQGDTFLHHVFAANHIQVINELVKLPQWNALSKTTNTESNWTLFDVIADTGREEYYSLLRHLVRKKYDLSYALHLAANHGHEGFCKRLLKDKAEPDTTDEDNNTALILAARNGHAKICTLLLKSGANPHLKNKNGQTAEECWSGLSEDNPFQKHTSQSLAKLGIFATTADESSSLKHAMQNKINSVDTETCLTSGKRLKVNFRAMGLDNA